MDIGRIRYASKAVTARLIHSAIHRFELEWSELDAGRAVAGSRWKRPLSRGEPGDGMAARGFSRADAEKPARPCQIASGADDWPSAGSAGDDPSLRAAGRSGR